MSAREATGSKHHAAVLIATVVVCTFGVAVNVAHAQLAPADGQGTRASDTGYAGGVGAHGNYAAQVPIDLPEARGGLPLPVSGHDAGGSAGDSERHQARLARWRSVMTKSTYL